MRSARPGPVLWADMHKARRDLPYRRIVRLRPGQACDLNTAQCLTHRRGSRTDVQRNRPVTKPIFKSVSQDLADTPHL